MGHFVRSLPFTAGYIKTTDLNSNWVNELGEICFPNLAHNNFSGLERETSEEEGKKQKNKKKPTETNKQKSLSSGS